MSSTAKTPDEIDQELMVRVQADDAEAFRELYDRHCDRALIVARSICPSRSSAEDAVQEGFLSVWRSRSRYRPELGSFEDWSMAVVKHRAIDATRREGAVRRPRTTELRQNVADGMTSPEEAAEATSDSDALRKALRELPETQAEVINLAFFKELTHTEIAEQLHLPRGTVKGRIRLGMKKLRKSVIQR